MGGIFKEKNFDKDKFPFSFPDLHSDLVKVVSCNQAQIMLKCL